MESKGEIVLYKSGKDFQIDVQLQDETVWLTQEQMAALFAKGRTTITEHIRNIFKEEELNQKEVCRNFRHTTPHGAKKGKTQTKDVKHYYLDVIISVGYRVKSKQGTQFRKWANRVLKDYLIKGYALNEKRLKDQTERIRELEQSLEIFKRVSENYQLVHDEFQGIINVITDYTYALDILDQ